MSYLILDWALTFEPNKAFSKTSVVRFNQLYLMKFVKVIDWGVNCSKFNLLRLFGRKLVDFFKIKQLYFL